MLDTDTEVPISINPMEFRINLLDDGRILFLEKRMVCHPPELFDAFSDIYEQALNSLGTARTWDDIPLPPSAVAPYEESYTKPESGEGICSMLRGRYGRDAEALAERLGQACGGEGVRRIIMAVSDQDALCRIIAAAGSAGATLIPAAGAADREIDVLA